MTPMSAHILILAGSETVGTRETEGGGHEEKERPRHNTGYNVAQYDRLLQPLENDGYNTGNNQNYGKIRY